MKKLRNTAIALALVIALLGAFFYVNRPQPITPEAITTSVTRTPSLLERAWKLPAAAAYKHQLDWQSNGSKCGPATLANVFRSLGEAATSEAKVVADTGFCSTGVCVMGLTLDQLAQIARQRTKRTVTVLRDLSADAFRKELRRSNDPALRYTINFTRKKIFDGGGGHHSPIGGYLEPEDLVFVLDVNKTFQPWLIERTRLFAAMDTLDGDHKRGMLRIE
jgi:hypothetical protein